MADLKDKALMNLPSDVRLLIATGRSSLYRLPRKLANKGAYLLAISHNDTFFVNEEGKIGAAAGKLGEVEVEDVVRMSDATFLPSIKVSV